MNPNLMTQLIAGHIGELTIRLFEAQAAAQSTNAQLIDAQKQIEALKAQITGSHPNLTTAA